MENLLEEKELRELLKQKCAITSQTDVAKQIGVSKTLISDLINTNKPIPPKVAKWLGYEKDSVVKQTYFRKINGDKDL